MQLEDDDQGAMKVVMTGSASDPADWQRHIRNKPRRESLANHFRNAADPFRLVLVRDMWLRGHGLMQARAFFHRRDAERWAAE